MDLGLTATWFEGSMSALNRAPFLLKGDTNEDQTLYACRDYIGLTQRSAG